MLVATTSLLQLCQVDAGSINSPHHLCRKLALYEPSGLSKREPRTNPGPEIRPCLQPESNLSQQLRASTGSRAGRPGEEGTVAADDGRSAATAPPDLDFSMQGLFPKASAKGSSEKKRQPAITTLQSPHSNHHTTITTLYNHHTPISTLPSPQYHHITSAIKFSLIS